MLVLFENLVRRTRWLKIPLLLAFLGMLGVSTWMILMAPVRVQDQWLIPTIVGTLWLLLSGSAMLAFQDIPQANYENLGWAGKIRRKLARLLFHMLAWFILIVSLALIVVSFQLMMAWYRST
ncbi:hypothetical protein [Pseudohongiella spirulinae]|uniref:Uncharacterized protein n=1 Tax=Pseudohongiella spirulinae TaxID=1249552 RepID=A0A0S2KH75_9GAMM|nr:hypothetical protein [Pseudohongiella spirulinae]ALO47661.1 hypothetical protein PS2015_3036 [Pseudohongiella spirulinae]